MFLEKWKESPKDRTLYLITLLTFIPFLTLTIVFCLNELRLASTGFGVLDLELAWTPDMINTIFAAWETAEM